MKVFSFRNFRVLILLALLVFAVIYTQEQSRQTRYWHKPVNVTIFPINGDNHPATQAYIQQLTQPDFDAIDQFFIRQGKQFQLTSEQPINLSLGNAVDSMPPSPPANASVISVMLWSLQLRYWAYKHTPDNVSNHDRVRLFVLYHQPQQNQALQHSLGLAKGLIGVIHAYADSKQNQQNNIVIAHELLHTFGATDKYADNNQPIFPIGYAEPEKTPLYPQRYAEIMAGRLPLSAQTAKMPDSLKTVIIGNQTAQEINWMPKP